ncbi:hypothetical protein [Vitreimonas flagellata]|uniref:hypothetical protein n=1 Tax=Vitreimonas flagellata TaxID=2560861 RepID=UPI0010755527|nr:hypothetical protein [Vitreimonas flagellata]
MPLWFLARIVRRMELEFRDDDLPVPAEAAGERVLRLISPIEAVLSIFSGSDQEQNSHAMYALAIALAIRLQRLPLPERRVIGEGALAMIRVSAFGPYREDDDDEEELGPDDEAPYG